MRTKKSPSGQESAPERSFIEKTRRAQIIDCAIETIAEFGYAGASLSRIAERAGISKGVISYHFAGKTELLTETVRHIYIRAAEQVIATWFEPLENPTARERLMAYLRGNLTYIAEHPLQIGVLAKIFTNLRDDHGQSVFGAETERPALEPLEEFFTQGQESGEFRPFDGTIMAIAVRRVIDGFSEQLLSWPDLDVPTYIDEMCALFDHATRVTPTSKVPASAPTTGHAGPTGGSLAT